LGILRILIDGIEAGTIFDLYAGWTFFGDLWMDRRIFLVCLLMPVLCRAEIITVDDDGPADFNNIQAAIDYSSNGDIIIVQPGHYDGSPQPFKGQKIIHFLGKNIILTSINPSNFDIVSSTVIEAVIIFNGKENSNCTLSGFKIVNDKIFSRSGIIGNNYEGDEYPFRTKATIMNCILQRNTYGPELITKGECIYSCDGLIENCIIVDNLNLNVERPIPSVYNCYGKIKNCTIANNDSACGIYVGPNPGHLELENCVLYGNQGYLYEKHFLFDVQLYVSEGSSVSISFCDIQGGLEDIKGTGSVLWGPGNIDSDPCFAREGFWDTFEGDYHLKSQAGRWDPNTQNWVIDDVTSPCIDAGNPGCPLGSEPKDSNNVRINMGAFGGTPLASKTPSDWRSISDLANDWIVDSNDLSIFTDYWLGTDRCLPSDLNRNLKVDFEDYSIFADNWLLGLK